MKKIVLFVSVLGLAAAGCGDYPIGCLCKDGTHQDQQAGLGDESMVCPGQCAGHGGWSGACVAPFPATNYPCGRDGGLGPPDGGLDAG